MQLAALVPVLGLLAALSGVDANAHRAPVARRAHHMPRSVNGNTLAALSAKRDGSKKCRVRVTPNANAAAAVTATLDATASAVSASPSASSAAAPAPSPSADTGNYNAPPPAAQSDSSSDSSSQAGTSDAAPSASQPAPAASSAAPSTGGGGSGGPKAGTIPNGIKAGTSSGNGLSQFAPHIGWWYDWNPVQSSNDAPNAVYVPMLWGSGGLGGDQDDSNRLAQFKTISDSPKYIMGFEEPDCNTPGSAAMSIETTIGLWNELIAPHAQSGSLLISPSMCHQIAETYMQPFTAGISTPYDITNVHINKNSMDGVRAALDHYAQYGKPMWITEFACVDDSTGFVPCEDVGQITQFIGEIVDLLQNDDRVHGYSFSNGLGLGSNWRLTQDDGTTLTPAGQAYLSAISKYH